MLIVVGMVTTTERRKAETTMSIAEGLAGKAAKMDRTETVRIGRAVDVPRSTMMAAEIKPVAPLVPAPEPARERVRGYMFEGYFYTP